MLEAPVLRWLLAADHLLALGIGLGAVWVRARALTSVVSDRAALPRAFAALRCSPAPPWHGGLGERPPGVRSDPGRRVILSAAKDRSRHASEARGSLVPPTRSFAPLRMTALARSTFPSSPSSPPSPSLKTPTYSLTPAFRTRGSSKYAGSPIRKVTKKYVANPSRSASTPESSPAAHRLRAYTALSSANCVAA